MEERREAGLAANIANIVLTFSRNAACLSAGEDAPRLTRITVCAGPQADSIRLGHSDNIYQ